jgi:thioredoxin-related protein
MARILVFLSLLLMLSSCSRVGGLVSKLKPGEEEDKFGKIPKVPAHLRAGGNATVKVEPAEERTVAAGVDPASLSTEQGGIAGLPSESDMIFTNPDDAEASEAAIEGLFSVQKKDWLSSHTVAKNLALVESKPLLILFTDTPSSQSGGSPAAARLESELLARNDFADWAGEKFVRLKLDFNVKDRRSADTAKQTLAVKKENYLLSLKKRYKVGGFPAIIVVAADGSVVQNVRGYRTGTSEYVWGLLKTAAVISESKQKKFEDRVLKKGYRRWQGKNKQKILAKLVSYREGDLVLVAPNGVRYRTHEKNVSAEDREWIQQQKEKRKAR